MSLQIKKTRDLPYHNILRLNPISGSQVRVVLGFQIGPEIEARKNAAVELRSPNPRLQILLAHRMGHHDEMIGKTTGQALRVLEKQVGPRSLEWTKGRTMNRMNHARHPCQPCRKPPQQARLAAVRMDNIGASLPKAASQRKESPHIMPRMHGTHQMRLQPETLRQLLRKRLQTPLRSRRGPRDERYLYARYPAQPEHRREGILLRSANDQAGDNMLNSHCSAPPQWVQARPQAQVQARPQIPQPGPPPS